MRIAPVMRIALSIEGVERQPKERAGPLNDPNKKHGRHRSQTSIFGAEPPSKTKYCMP